MFQDFLKVHVASEILVGALKDILIRFSIVGSVDVAWQVFVDQILGVIGLSIIVSRARWSWLLQVRVVSAICNFLPWK